MFGSSAIGYNSTTAILDTLQNNNPANNPFAPICTVPTSFVVTAVIANVAGASTAATFGIATGVAGFITILTCGFFYKPTCEAMVRNHERDSLLEINEPPHAYPMV